MDTTPEEQLTVLATEICQQLEFVNGHVIEVGNLLIRAQETVKAANIGWGVWCEGNIKKVDGTPYVRTTLAHYMKIARSSDAKAALKEQNAKTADANAKRREGDKAKLTRLEKDNKAKSEALEKLRTMNEQLQADDKAAEIARHQERELILIQERDDAKAAADRYQESFGAKDDKIKELLGQVSHIDFDKEEHAVLTRKVKELETQLEEARAIQSVVTASPDETALRDQLERTIRAEYEAKLAEIKSVLIPKNKPISPFSAKVAKELARMGEVLDQFQADNAFDVKKADLTLVQKTFHPDKPVADEKTRAQAFRVISAIIASHKKRSKAILDKMTEVAPAATAIINTIEPSTLEWPL